MVTFEPFNVLADNFFFSVLILGFCSPDGDMNPREIGSGDLGGVAPPSLGPPRRAPHCAELACLQLKPAKRVDATIGKMGGRSSLAGSEP